MYFSTGNREEEEEEEEQTSSCKLVPSLIREACAHLRASSCLKSTSNLSSDDEEEEDSLPDTDLDYKHVIILEFIRSRGLKAKQKPKDCSFVDSLHWVLSPTTGKLLIAPKEEEKDEEVKVEVEHREDGSEAFYSVKSCFSHCSSEKEKMEMLDYLKDFGVRSKWEEFCHLEGWPFGLWRRALMLPPLPNSPVDSWTWRKRNLGPKV